MPDQFVKLPPEVLGSSQKFDALQLLATIGRFACPGAWPPNQLERDLEVRFSGKQTVSYADAAAWLSEVGIKLSSLTNQITALGFLQALQSQNDAGALQLLEVLDASKLIELEDAGETSLTPRPLWSRTEPCMLLRLGYNTERAYAYYTASLPGDSRRPIKLTWESVVAANISGALAVPPPAKTVEVQALADALHILEQAIAAATAAHATIMATIGETPQASLDTTPPAQTVAEQVV